ncbi:5-methyltetrahydrofolate--homocysteine methyltransferase (EC [Olavius algarvensis associated proteobacterium Delta 3]|nr:5-methyltetrahydrofolate--homocysteine methyltransferase (EC [Olavius algarvensis associated proteobacterium Delta 3]CAB5152604.1 5-methyltetrahydrofolate--homocysteine methyltransferase (EC [Olavius algarvensis associated proteobacterium Delta 3]
MADNLTTTVSSKNQTVDINRALPTVVIGERINPTGRRKLQAELEAHVFNTVQGDAVAQVEAGAKILDVNAGVPDADEPKLIAETIRAVTAVTDAPICIDTANPEALAAALEIYEGKALVNSVNGETRSLETVLPLVKEHGAAVIGLCMDDDGIPALPEKRLAVAEKIIQRAAKLGIATEDVVIDPLVLTVSVESDAALLTLKTTELIVKEFGVNITMGASNVSFGLPDRSAVNAAFMAIAIRAGLTCPITNPLDPDLAVMILAADLALGKDEWGERWIAAYRSRNKPD